jgi:hypothetical protein
LATSLNHQWLGQSVRSVIQADFKETIAASSVLFQIDQNLSFNRIYS